MNAFLPAEEAKQKMGDILGRLLAPTKETFHPEPLRSVLQHLSSTSDSKCFKNLKEFVDDDARRQLVLERVGRSRESAANHTPDLIKGLKPDVQACYLVWQTHANSHVGDFEGYYPKADPGLTRTNKKGKTVQTHHSISRRFGTGKHTQTEALYQVVSQLWKWHGKFAADAEPRFKVYLSNIIDCALKSTVNDCANEWSDFLIVFLTFSFCTSVPAKQP